MKMNFQILAKDAVVALGAMAQGLFASLLIGTIISTLGQQIELPIFVEIGNFAKSMAGPAMAIAIAFSLKASPLVVFSSAAVGAAANGLGGAGGPLAVYVLAFINALAMLLAPSIGNAASSVGELIIWATDQQPFVMGIVVSVVMGICLTLPISSAAICAALGLTGLAGGAALAGCCAQMVGFAFMSFKENKWSGLVSQGIGTSMLQMGNIVKNPCIWFAPILVSAITGPLATCLFRLEMNGPAISSGMGTCGFVGQIGVYTGWMAEIASGSRAVISSFDWLALFLISFIIPALLTPLIALPLRRRGWIKEGDMKI